MKWIEPRHGDQRKRWVFPLFPLTIGRETRWLTWCYILEKFGNVRYDGMPYGGTSAEWYPVAFLKEEEGENLGGFEL